MRGKKEVVGWADKVKQEQMNMSNKGNYLSMLYEREEGEVDQEVEGRAGADKHE